ncbi:hypothetical protein BRETT_000741 [Brettanomyces bruxellensis]|uniref:MICOS complex subunit MIC12 n=1 Tax=Dekkera bruxellensis TaxID=5007 RepID=A0A871R8J1_DEKBR|nr:uncharacterized protein BRETT_000741 [Brettanomyces bruxellensis]QOU21024.1 hypothetical protein BRETT_000741 [Brettanomyces bruxellensis]
MSGVINGLLSGFLLSGSITYLTVLKFHNDQRIVSEALNDTTMLVKNHGKVVEPQSNVIFYKQRMMKEAIKDIWNYEVIKSVNWLYSLNISAATDSLLEKLLPAPEGLYNTDSDSN